MRRILTLTVLFSLNSCSFEQKDYGVDYEEDTKLTDKLNTDEFLLLQRDEEYVEYIEDYISKQEVLSSHLDDGLKFFAIEELTKDEDEQNVNNIIGGVSSFSSSAFSLVKILKYKNLEKEEEKLYKSYSKEKKELAKKFQSQIKTIYDSISLIKPTSLDYKKKPKYHQINYWSINKYLKTDSSLSKELTSLANLADKYFKLSHEFKKELFFSRYNGFNTNSTKMDSIYNSSLDRIENPKDLEFSLKTNTLSELIELQNKTLNKIGEIIKTNKDSIVEWSNAKEQSFMFVLGDVVSRITIDVILYTKNLKVSKSQLNKIQTNNFIPFDINSKN